MELRNLVFFLLSCLTSSMFAQVPNNFVFDKIQSQSFGAENGIMFHRIIYEKTDEFIPLKFNDEATTLRKGAGIGYRFLKVSLLDLQIDWMFMLIQHEVFGHGSRAREFGYSNNAYGLNLLPPFGPGDGFIFLGDLSRTEMITNTEDLTFILGGNEGNILFSEKITSRIVLQENIHYRQAMLNILTKNNLGFYIWADKFAFDKGGSRGDINSYVNNINRVNLKRENNYSIDKLAKQSLISLLNPFQWYSAYVLTKDYLIDGNATGKKIPSFKFSKLNYLPSLGYNLTPFGAEFIFTNYFYNDSQSLQVNLNYGDQTFFDFYTLGLKGFNIIPNQKFYIGAELQLWSQPELQLEDNTGISQEGTLGMLFKVDCSYFPSKESKQFGLFGQLGYKSKGYVLGEKLDKGFIAQFGLSYRTK